MTLPTFTVAFDMSTCAVIGREIATHLAQSGALQYADVDNAGGFLTAQAAADFLGVTRKRVHDLTSMGALVPDGRDGRTPLYLRETLTSYAAGRLTHR